MDDITISTELIHTHRIHTYRLNPDMRLKSLKEAVDYINERGIISFWPIKGRHIPSLWTATAGDRPVPNNHDDPGHVTWGWKDELLGNKYCFYARIFCRRNFFISLDVLPFLYTLANHSGEYADDHIKYYQSGILSRSAFIIYDKLLQNGTMDTITLKREAHLSGKEGDHEFNQAIDHLQDRLMIFPTGISRNGGWHYSFVYDLVPRNFPGLIDRTRFITDVQARKELIKRVFSSNGFLTMKEISSLFKWDVEKIRASINDLVIEDVIRSVSLNKNGIASLGYMITNLV